MPAPRSTLLPFPRSALLLAICTCAFTANVLADQPLPRYRLAVGQELSYRGKSEFKYEQGRLITRESWKIWVVRENPDQSWRLVLKYGSAFSQVRDKELKSRNKAGKASEKSAVESGKRKPDKSAETPQAEELEEPEEVTFAWCDLYPDGRIVDNDSFGFRMQPAKVLPKLPADSNESAKGWTSQDLRMDDKSVYRLLPAPAEHRSAIEAVHESPMNSIYGVESRAVVTFDNERGLPERITTENRQTFGFKGQGAGAVELVGVEMHPLRWTQQLADDAERYFAARSAYDQVTRRKDLSPDELEMALKDAVAELEHIGETLQTAELKKLLEDQTSNRDKMLAYLAESARDRAALVGTPSEDWTTTDLDGRTHALKDYRGKVVILDFWYRGCGWCIRAMPQMKQVAAHFEEEPVVVFGMNTDRKEEDARFVVEKMGLTYANLKATGLPEKYKVQGFPTLLILDQEGVIRDIHVGYSPTLRDEVIESVDRLLQAKP